MAVLTKNKKQVQRLWRPDFRTMETLPDTKVIRTGFLLNFIAITLAVAAATTYLVKEYQLQNLIRDVDSLKAQVVSNTARNRQILDTNKRFLKSADVVEEAIAFDWQPVSFYSLIRDLSGSLQEGMVLSNFQIHYEAAPDPKAKKELLVLDLSGKVLENAPTTPAQLLGNYQKALRSMTSLEGRTVTMDMTRFGRNNELGHFDFTLQIKISIDKAPSI